MKRKASILYCIVALICICGPGLRNYDCMAVEPLRLISGRDTTLVSKSGSQTMEFHGKWDLSGYSRVRFTVTNHDDVSYLMLMFSLNNEKVVKKGKAPKHGTLIVKHDVAPGQTRTIEVVLPAPLAHPEVDDKFWRMACTPYSAAYDAYSYRVDLKDIREISLDARKIYPGMKWTVSDLEFIPGPQEQPASWALLPESEFFPFIDCYGQFKYKDWPGKIHEDNDLVLAAEKEAADLAANPGPSDWSRYGGWKNGPKMKATGRFRVEKVDGKWWLIDPDGYLFWSHGVVRVNPSSAVTPLHSHNLPDRTFYFENLPEPGSEFYQFYYTQDELLKSYYDIWGVDSTYDFSSANLYRKYGTDYRSKYAELAHVRLKSWGMNTISNSSDKDICLMDRTAYVDRIHVHAPVIEGTTGSSWKFADPYTPEFGESVKQQLLERSHEISDPWCIGFFVDNELKWGDEYYLAQCTSRAPETQAAKVAMMRWLKKKYHKVEALNSVWGTSFASWDSFMKNRKAVDAKKSAPDMREFNRQIMHKYFGTIRKVFDKVAPGLLYLGCRYSVSNSDVIPIGAMYSDIVSFNRYRYELETFHLPEGVDKPVMIGEFHFGARDRGMLHGSLIDVESQEARGEAYEQYVRTALQNPCVIGVQWHQYADQATTGRFDGENYHVGLLDVCDTPYYETIDKVREVGYGMYEIRWKK